MIRESYSISNIGFANYAEKLFYTAADLAKQLLILPVMKLTFTSSYQVETNAAMDKIHYNLDGEILTINYPIDASGHYCVETDNDVELGHLFVDGISQDTGTPMWKGTTTEVNNIA